MKGRVAIVDLVPFSLFAFVVGTGSGSFVFFWVGAGMG